MKRSSRAREFCAGLAVLAVGAMVCAAPVAAQVLDEQLVKSIADDFHHQTMWVQVQSRKGYKFLTPTSLYKDFSDDHTTIRILVTLTSPRARYLTIRMTGYSGSKEFYLFPSISIDPDVKIKDERVMAVLDKGEADAQEALKEISRAIAQP